jgi:hypothetical protein
MSVSQWLSQVAAHAAAVEDGRRAVREHEAEHGEISDADRSDARRVLDELDIRSS